MKIIRKSLLLFFVVSMICSCVAITPFGIQGVSVAISASYSEPSVTPPAGVHPRILFRTVDIPNDWSMSVSEKNTTYHSGKERKVYLMDFSPKYANGSTFKTVIFLSE